jgi:Ni/Co efflux regulator RcnB
LPEGNFLLLPGSSKLNAIHPLEGFMSFKSWFRTGAIALLSLALFSTIAVGQERDHGYDHHDRDDDHNHDWERDHGHDYEHDHAYEHARAREGYHEHDREIREWYHAHYAHLPPGLAKRDRLSPEWERQLVVHAVLPVGLRARMQPCPHELEVMLPPPAPGFAHVFVGGNLVLVNRANFQVVDSFHFDLP